MVITFCAIVDVSQSHSADIVFQSQKFIDYVGDILQAYVDRREQVSCYHLIDTAFSCRHLLSLFFLFLLRFPASFYLFIVCVHTTKSTDCCKD